MVDKAVLIEDSRRELEGFRKRKMMQHGVPQGRLQRFRTNEQHPVHFAPPATFKTTAPTPRPAVSGIINNQPQGSNHPAPGVTCYRCHEIGHYAHSCPRKRAPTPIPFNLGATPARVATPGTGQGTTQASSQATRTPLSSARGRVNQVTVETAQPAQNFTPGKSESVQFLFRFCLT